MKEKKKIDQSSCSPVSSNCVIWQGPDIPCINLCKGDSITDVTYKLASELCDLLNLVNISNFKIECFEQPCPKLENVGELLQFILDKLCELKDCCEEREKQLELQLKATNNLYLIASCFKYINQLGVQVTTMTLDDYITAIGNKVCELKSNFDILQEIVTNIDERLTILESTVSSLPSPPDLILATSCLFPIKTNIPILEFVVDTETVLCTYINVLGTISELNDAINQICVDDSDFRFDNPSRTYSELPGWVNQSQYSTIADTITNMWLVICDIKTGLLNVQNCCNQTCSQVVLDMDDSLLSLGDNLTYNINNIGPINVMACNTNSDIVVQACGYSNSYDYQHKIDIVDTIIDFKDLFPGLPLSIMYTISWNICFELADGTQCYKNFTRLVRNENFVCPNLSWQTGSTAGSAQYSFSSQVTLSSCPVTYLVTVYEAGTSNILAIDSFISSGGAIARTITVGVPRPVDIEWEITMIQGPYTVSCNRTGTFTIPA